MNLFSHLFEKRPDPREAIRPVWKAVVELARKPDWYAKGGVEDSVTGRFDMVSMVTSLVLLRMENDSELAAPSALLTECFVEDMEGQLREFGVNDVVVGKRVGKLVGSLGGRLGALREAIPQGKTALAKVVNRNLRLTDHGRPEFIAKELHALALRLEATSNEALLGGSLGAEASL